LHKTFNPIVFMGQSEEIVVEEFLEYINYNINAKNVLGCHISGIGWPSIRKIEKYLKAGIL